PRHRREPRGLPAPRRAARARDERRRLPAARQDRAPRARALLRRHLDRGRVRRRQAGGDRLPSRSRRPRRSARRRVDGGRSPRVRRGRPPAAGTLRRVDRSWRTRPAGGQPSPPASDRPLTARADRGLTALSSAGFERRLCVRARASSAGFAGATDPGGSVRKGGKAPLRVKLAAAPVKHLTPAPVVVAARLAATGEIGRRGHHLVVSAVARRCMGLAPAHVEDLQAWVSVGFTAWTVRAGDGRGVRNELRHRSLARLRIAISLYSSVPSATCKTY